MNGWEAGQVLPAGGSFGQKKIMTAKISFVLKGNVWYSG